VIDAGSPRGDLGAVVEAVRGGTVIVVVNKCDLVSAVKCSAALEILGEPVFISAKTGTGMELLYERIPRSLGVDRFDPAVPVCFTARQQRLVEALAGADTAGRALGFASRLLGGPVEV
jgi:50S ribosomal subunit-associated GTPase HflX